MKGAIENKMFSYYYYCYLYYY